MAGARRVGRPELGQDGAHDGLDEVPVGQGALAHSAEALLDRADLSDAPGVALLGAGGGQEGLDDLRAARFASTKRAPEGEDVGVVVLAGVLRGGGVDAGRGAHAGHLVGGHGGADAGPVHEDAEPGVPGLHGLGHREGHVGIVHGLGGERAVVVEAVARGGSGAP